jgi:hypothetical protein
MAPEATSMPSGADELWWRLAEILTEYLPQSYRTKFGELSLRAVYYEGRLVKAEGNFKCAVRPKEDTGESDS